MSEPLKPCLHCGSTAFTFAHNQGAKWGFVACADCAATGPEVRTSYDLSDDAAWHEEAIKAWNTRAEPERQVLGVGHLRIVTDFRGEQVRMIGISEPDTGELSDLDCKPVMCGRYKLIVIKEADSE